MVLSVGRDSVEPSSRAGKTSRLDRVSPYLFRRAAATCLRISDTITPWIRCFDPSF
jgi:hypothetical protein